MNPVGPGEIKSLADYEIARPQFRERILAIKRPRRIAVGEHLTLLFENHDTVLYQVQEMLRVEKISEPRAISHEIRTYNELLGGTDELGATLLIEYSDADERDVKLRELLGLEDHVRLEVEGVGSCKAAFDRRQLGEDRISSVHYVHFALGAKLAVAIRNRVRPTIVVDHPAMQVRIELSNEQTAALAEDLSS